MSDVGLRWRPKDGVDLGPLRLELSRLAVPCETVYQEFGAHCTVTATTKGQHMPGSFHGRGAAVDMRVNQFATKMQLLLYTVLCRRLGDLYPHCYDVLLEDRGEPNAHIHIEPSPALAATMFPRADHLPDTTHMIGEREGGDAAK